MHTDCCWEGGPIQQSPACGGRCALQRKGMRCCVSAWEDEHQSCRRETGILVPPLCLLFVERGSLGSFGAFSAGVSSIPSHLPSVAQEVGDAGMPQAQEGGPVMEVLVKPGYRSVHAAGPVGMRGNCLSSKGSESRCCPGAHLGTFWG